MAGYFLYIRCMIHFDPLITKSKNYLENLHRTEEICYYISVNQNTEVSYMATRKKSSAKRQTKKERMDSE